MSREQVTLKVSGLWTYEDVFSAVPEGSLSVAKNVVIDQKNLVSPRRGYQSLPIGLSGGGDINFTNGQSLFEFNGYTHYHRASGEFYYWDGAEWVAYAGTFVKPGTTNRSRSAIANKNFYITSNNGVQKITTLGGSIVDSGARPGYAPTATVTTAGTGSLFTATSDGVAYRIVWGYKDANMNLVLGAPSNRTVVISTGANQDASLSFQIPSNVTTDWFYQIYRTKVLTSATPLTVGDRMYLAAEGNPTAQQITDGVVGNGTGGNPNFIDNQPDDLLGLELYTNDTSEGIAQANYEPPQCVDMAFYQNYMFYANTKQKAAITIQLLGTGADALQAGDTQKIGALYFKASAAPSNSGKDGSLATPYEYLLVNAGTSPSQDVEQTAKNLINTINKYHPVIDAYYFSEISAESVQLPGQIRLTEKDFNLAPNFTVSDSGTNISWSPNLQTVQTATSDEAPNRVFYSKFGKPEAVPLLNYFDVGPANTQIRRILPLRTSLLVFTNREIYQLSGTTSDSFRVDMLDNTARLIADDSLVTLNNTAIGLFDQGVCQVSESLTVLSRAIEGDLLTIRGLSSANINSLAFGIGYESDRKYILYLPFTAGDTTSAKGAYVYNIVTNTWTLWDKTYKFGILNYNQDKLFMLAADSVSLERKNYNESDIADEQEIIPLLRVFKGTYDTPLLLTSTYPDGVDPDEADRRTGFFAFVTSTGTAWEWSVVNNQWEDSEAFELVPSEANVFYVDPTTLLNVQVGDVYYEDETKFSKVLAVDPETITFTVQDALDWSGGTWEVQKVIPIEIRYNPIYMSNPSMLKQFSEVTLITSSSLEGVRLGFKGVTSSGFEYIPFEGIASGGWGLFSWGDVPWGGDAEVLRYRTLVPRDKQRDSALVVSVLQDTIYNNFEISGLSIIYRVIGPRVIR